MYCFPPGADAVAGAPMLQYFAHRPSPTASGGHVVILWDMLGLLFSVNALVVAKYAPRVGLHPLAAVAALAIVWAVAGLAMRAVGTAHPARLPVIYGVVAACSFAAFALVLARVDIHQVLVTRWSAITGFNDALLSGTFPYLGRTHLGQPPSGLPALYLLALPFQLLGEVGLLQLAVYAAFCVGIYRSAGTAVDRLTAIGLLALSPAYLWEVAVRSDLFSNAALVVLLMWWCERASARAGRAAIWTSLGAGVLCATRVFAAIPLAIYLPGAFRDRPILRLAPMAGVALLAFAAVVLPFALWNLPLFLQNNPFLPQGDKAPMWLSACALGGAVAIGAMRPTFFRACRASAWLLFGVVAITCGLAVAADGWHVTLYHTGVDVSYFMLSVPFALAAIAEGRAPAPGAAEQGHPTGS